jgi:hypothetical protein
VTPGVSGHLRLNSAPVEGVKVYVVDRLQSKSCTASKLEATTDMRGAFSISSTRAFEWNMPGDRIVSWSLCVNYKDEWIVGYEEQHLGYPRENVQLECELSATPQSQGDNPCREGDA